MPKSPRIKIKQSISKETLNEQTGPVWLDGAFWVEVSKMVWEWGRSLPPTLQYVLVLAGLVLPVVAAYWVGRVRSPAHHLCQLIDHLNQELGREEVLQEKVSNRKMWMQKLKRIKDIAGILTFSATLILVVVWYFDILWTNKLQRLLAIPEFKYTLLGLLFVGVIIWNTLNIFLRKSYQSISQEKEHVSEVSSKLLKGLIAEFGEELEEELKDYALKTLTEKTEHYNQGREKLLQQTAKNKETKKKLTAIEEFYGRLVDALLNFNWSNKSDMARLKKRYFWLLERIGKQISCNPLLKEEIEIECID